MTLKDLKEIVDSCVDRVGEDSAAYMTLCEGDVYVYGNNTYIQQITLEEATEGDDGCLNCISLKITTS